MTAAGWSAPPRFEHRALRRRELGIPEDAVVFGLVGSLDWTEGIEYCYGLELVRGVLEVDRDDLRVVVIGDGTGLKRLRTLAATRRQAHPAPRAASRRAGHQLSRRLRRREPAAERGPSGPFATRPKITSICGWVFRCHRPDPARLRPGRRCIWRLAGESPWTPTSLLRLPS